MDISPQRVRTAEFRTVKRGLDPDEVREFFGAFFELPVEQWRGYMRIDTPPSEVAAVMTKVVPTNPSTLISIVPDVGLNPRASATGSGCNVHKLIAKLMIINATNVIINRSRTL